MVDLRVPLKDIKHCNIFGRQNLQNDYIAKVKIVSLTGPTGHKARGPRCQQVRGQSVCLRCMLTFLCESQAHTTKTRRGTGTEQRHQSSIKPPDEDKKQSRENTKKSHKENQKYQKETQEHHIRHKNATKRRKTTNIFMGRKTTTIKRHKDTTKTHKTTAKSDKETQNDHRGIKV